MAMGMGDPSFFDLWIMVFDCDFIPTGKQPLTDGYVLDIMTTVSLEIIEFEALPISAWQGS